MSQEQIDRIIELIENAGGTALEIATRQVIVSAITHGIIAALCLTALVVVAVIARRFWRKPISTNSYGWDAGDRAFAMAFCGLGAALPLVGLISSFYVIVTALVNPEFAALRQLAGLVGSGS